MCSCDCGRLLSSFPIEVQLIYNVVLTSAVQQSDSDRYTYIYIYTHIVFNILFHYDLL